MSHAAHATCPAALDFTMKPLAGDSDVHLCEAYSGDVLLVVNVASKCGYTPQYNGLEEIYEQYKDQGFAVLGFPSNDFGGQEPGTEAEVKEFCRLTYGVQFPMFEKTRAAKAEADPFYQALAEQAGEFPKWNFHKYLINRNGDVVASFPSGVEPKSDELTGQIEALLAAPKPTS